MKFVNNRKFFVSILVFIVLVAAFLFAFDVVRHKKRTYKNTVRFLQFKQDPIQISSLAKDDKVFIEKYRKMLGKCIESQEEKDDIVKLKKAFLNLTDEISPNEKRKRVALDFDEIEKILGKDPRDLIQSVRKCHGKVKSDFTVIEKKRLKTIISKLSMKDIIEIYDGIN
jgi:hypothetical protein